MRHNEKSEKNILKKLIKIENCQSIGLYCASFFSTKKASPDIDHKANVKIDSRRAEVVPGLECLAEI